jgi:hypothetical protein
MSDSNPRTDELSSGRPYGDVGELRDRFTATTTSMIPIDATLRIVVDKWCDESARKAVVTALAGGPDASTLLTNLPTVGYVWPSIGAVWYALKYTHRAHAGHGERLTFVTDKRLGYYEMRPWTASTPVSPGDLEYSVIELYLDDRGSGGGTMSLAAAVELDADRAVVSLAAYAGAPQVLKNAVRESNLRWTRGQ